MIETLIAILIVALIGYVCFWLVGQVGLPEPIRTIVLAFLAIILIAVLLGFLGVGGVHLRPG